MQKYLLDKVTNRVLVADSWHLDSANSCGGPIFLKTYVFDDAYEGYRSNIQLEQRYEGWDDFLAKYQFIDFYTALSICQVQCAQAKE